MGDEEEATPKTDEVDIRGKFNFPLVVKSDMHEEMLSECTESAVTCIEKHSENNENAAKMLKEIMDKKFGPSWHVIIGGAFGFEVTHQTTNLTYMYFGASWAVLVWKSA